MHMVRGRSTAPWTVIENREVRAQIVGKLQKRVRKRLYGLRDMIDVSDGVMPTKDGGGITQNKKLPERQNPLLFRREVPCTEKAWTLADRFRIDLCTGADDPARIKLKDDGKTVARNLPDLDRVKRGDPLRKLRPGRGLLLQETSGEFRKRNGRGTPVEL